MTKNSFLKQLLPIIRCSTCDRCYAAEDVSILGQEGELWFVSVSCLSCDTESLVAAVVQEIDSAEVITDLTEEEYAKFAQQETIEINDVLDMHNLLKDFHGDVSELLTVR